MVLSKSYRILQKPTCEENSFVVQTHPVSAEWRSAVFDLHPLNLLVFW